MRHPHPHHHRLLLLLLLLPLLLLLLPLPILAQTSPDNSTDPTSLDFIPNDVPVVTPPANAPAVSNSSLCIDPSHHMWRQVPCPTVRAAGNLEAAGSNPGIAAKRSDPSFTLLFSCRAEPAFCQKARNAFVFVGEQIKKILRLPIGVRVRADVFSFCKEQGIGCNGGDPSATVARQIGNAAPSLLIPLRDGDGRVRFYPQALVRQFRMFVHPAFAEADITARFSSDGDPWFPENAVPIRRDQTDFRWVALHEVLHGLGVGVTAWRDWAAPNGDQRQARLFTPYPVADLSRDLSEGFIFDGEFFETVFDAGLVDVGTQLPAYGPSPNRRPRRLPRLSNMVTTRLNYFRGRRPVRFRSLEHFMQSLSRTRRAGPRARKIRALIQEHDQAIAFDPEDGGSPILLTSGPRIVASNPTGVIGHLDQDVYIRSPDFIMCPTVVSGVTLEEHQRRVLVYNNPGKDMTQIRWDGSFVGPGVRRMLAYIGYDVLANNPAHMRPASEFYPPTPDAVAIANGTIAAVTTSVASSVNQVTHPLTQPAVSDDTPLAPPQRQFDNPLAQPAVVEPIDDNDHTTGSRLPIRTADTAATEPLEPTAMDRMAAPAVASNPTTVAAAADDPHLAPHSALVTAPPSADILPKDAPVNDGQASKDATEDATFPATKVDTPIQAPASHAAADDGIVGIIAPGSSALLGTASFTPATSLTSTAPEESAAGLDDDPVKVIDL